MDDPVMLHEAVLAVLHGHRLLSMTSVVVRMSRRIQSVRGDLCQRSPLFPATQYHSSLCGMNSFMGHINNSLPAFRVH